MPTSRRTVLSAAGASLAAFAGCTSRLPGSPDPSDRPGDGDRPTMTAREPDPLDVSGAWPQRGGGPDHAGVTDDVGVPDAGRAYWHLRRVRSGPAVLADGRLFHYAKLGEETGGRPTKTRTRDPDAGTAHPVYGVPHLVARDASEGRIQWRQRLSEPGVGWPAVVDGRVVATARGRVSAHDVTDGSERWSVPFGDGPVGPPTVADDLVVVPLNGVVDGSGEYVHEPEVRAFGLSDGQSRWTVGAPARGLGVAAAGDAVAVVAHDYDGDGSVQARSLQDGSERWRTDLSGTFSFEGPVLSGGRAYVASSGGTLHALSLSGGDELWTADRAGDGVAATDDVVFAVDGAHLAARDAADGGERWSVELADEGDERFVTPAVDGSTVYAGTTGLDARVRAYDRTDGTERWSSALPDTVVEGDMVVGGLETQPAVAGGAVYAYAADGLYAFGPD